MHFILLTFLSQQNEDNQYRQCCSGPRLEVQEKECDQLKSLLRKGLNADVVDDQGLGLAHRAATNNHVKCLKLILEQSNTIANGQTPEGATPLYLAVLNGNEEIIQLLLSKGADPNVGNSSIEWPLMLASRMQKLDIVRNLLNNGADSNCQSNVGATALHYAILSDSSIASIVEELVAKGAKLDARRHGEITPVHQAAQVGCLAALRLLLARAKETGRLQSLIEMGNKCGITPVMVATQKGFHECVDLLLQNGANCNKFALNHYTALHYAILYGHSRCAELLLEKMDDTVWRAYKVDKENPAVLDDDFGSPLHAAISCERHDIVEFILRSGVNPDAPISYSKHFLRESQFCLANQVFYEALIMCLPKLMMPLGLAAVIGSVEDMRILLRAGAQINPESDDILCPLLAAVFSGREDIVGFLLAHGADPNCSGRSSRRFFSRMLIMPVLKAGLLQVLLKFGADLRAVLRHTCVEHHLGDCYGNQVLVRHFQERHHLTVATLLRFSTLEMVKDYIDATFWKLRNALTLEENVCWLLIFGACGFPKTLVDLCCLTIRGCLLDNGSNIFPIWSQIRDLPMHARHRCSLTSL